MKLSAIVALLFGLFLAGAEAYRNWGDWQWWPFWVVDYVGAALLIYGGARVLRGGTKAWLTGGWGFTTAMFYMSFFSHIERLRTETGLTYGPDGSLSEDRLTQAIGLMLAIAALSFVMALWGRNKG
ncbi:MAG: hypothetical protein ACPG06_02440 [Alphaproteobacteria bacterium]